MATCKDCLHHDVCKEMLATVEYSDLNGNFEDAAKAFAIQTIYSTEDCEDIIRTALYKSWI